ncbi:MAG: diguanylate cyclase [Thermoleophilia bacterium]|nr:diguanylate cyclase [Thermoleophilia bacterium]
MIRPIPDGGGREQAPLDLARVESVFRKAALVAGAAFTTEAAIDGALTVLSDGLAGAAVAAYGSANGHLWPIAICGYALSPDRLGFDEGIVGRAVQTSAVQLVIDTASDSDFLRISAEHVSEIAIPLVTSAGLVGLIDIETVVPLPPGSDLLVGPLVEALGGRLAEMTAAPAMCQSAMTRLFVYLTALRDLTLFAQTTASCLGRMLPVDSSWLFVSDESGQLVCLAEWAIPDTSEAISEESLRVLSRSIDQQCEMTVLSTDDLTAPAFVNARISLAFLLPLHVHGKQIGLLVGTSRSAASVDRNQAESAVLLAAHTAASLDGLLALEREQRIAQTDMLTGLLNRRGLASELSLAIDVCQEMRRPLTVALFDCDDFKAINDRAGHAFGDGLLIEVARAFTRTCPEGGSVARLGGDEFVIVLPGVGADEALAVVERIRSEIEERTADAGFPTMLSGGLAALAEGVIGIDLLRMADQAMYVAKIRGKNSVVAYRDIVVGPSKDPPPEGASRRRSRDSRAEAGTVRSPLTETIESLEHARQASAAIWAEKSVEGILDRLTKMLGFVMGAPAVSILRVEGDRFIEVERYALNDVVLGELADCLVAHFPVSREVLETTVPQALSVMDEHLDAAEASVLTDLRMQAVFLLPLVVDGHAWGLVEIYDTRLRRFSDDDQSLSRFLVDQAARKIESLSP